MLTAPKRLSSCLAASLRELPTFHSFSFIYHSFLLKQKGKKWMYRKCTLLLFSAKYKYESARLERTPWAHALSAHLERTPWERPVSTLTQLWFEIAEISLDFHFRFVMVKAQPAMPVKLMPLAAHSFSWPTVANSTTKITTRVAQIIYSTEMETMIPYL